jgi:hypothetical protein
MLTLRGEGAGIWDGRWDEYFTEEQIRRLQPFLKDRLGDYADDTGTGKLNDAIREAAEDAAGVDDDDNGFGGLNGDGNGGAPGMFAMPPWSSPNPRRRRSKKRPRRRTVEEEGYLVGGWEAPGAAAEPMGDVRVSDVQPGTRLRLGRRAILARPDAPAERESVKTVAAVHPIGTGDVLIEFVGMKFPGHDFPRSFRGTVRNGWLLEVWTGPPRPLKYEVLGIVGRPRRRARPNVWDEPW